MQNCNNCGRWCCPSFSLSENQETDTEAPPEAIEPPDPPGPAPSEEGRRAEGLPNGEAIRRDEMNLAEFPIALLTDRASDGQKTLEFQDEIYDRRRHRIVKRKLTVTGSDKFGLPTATDDEVVLGLIHLTKRANNFTDRRVRFRLADLLKLLGWPDTGQSYRRIARSLGCWLGVTLYHENAWWDKQSGSWVTKGFHIIEGFEIAESAASGPDRHRMPSFPCEFTWNEAIFQSFQAGYLKALDFEVYRALEYPTAKRMYRFLDKHFFRAATLEYDLKAFACEHIGLSRQHTAAKLKEKLQPALEELEAIGFLVPMTREERYKKVARGEWTIRFTRQANPSPKPRPDQAEAEKGPTEWERALITRGVTPATAATLVAEFPAERVTRQIEVLDWLLGKSDQRVSKNPGGYLAESIRKDYVPPKGFQTRGEREKKAHEEDEKKRRAAEARRQDCDRAAAERARIDAYLDSLTPRERDELRATALQEADSAFAGLYRRSQGNPEVAARYLKIIIDMHVDGILAARGESGGEVRSSDAGGPAFETR